MLPVAEVENLLLLPEVVKALARHHGEDPDNVLEGVKRALFGRVQGQLDEQVLVHARHQVRQALSGIEQVEGDFATEVRAALDEFDPAATVSEIRSVFTTALDTGDYAAILLLYNGPKRENGLLPILRAHLKLDSKKDLARHVAILVREGRCSDVVEALRNALPVIPSTPPIEIQGPMGPPRGVVAAVDAVREALLRNIALEQDRLAERRVRAGEVQGQIAKEGEGVALLNTQATEHMISQNQYRGLMSTRTMPLSTKIGNINMMISSIGEQYMSISTFKHGSMLGGHTEKTLSSFPDISAALGSLRAEQEAVDTLVSIISSEGQAVQASLRDILSRIESAR